MPRDLTGKVMVITGASAGIGAATAAACARAGMRVVLNARRDDRLRAAADAITQRGGEVECVVGDVAAEGMSSRILDAAERRFGRFDIVFANAGYGIEKSFIDMTTQELRHIFEVNFFSGVDLLQTAAQRMIARDQRGHLLMCSSCLAKFTLPYYSAYSATKAAQNHICRAMRLELESHGIAVSSVHPITTTTEFFQVSERLSGHNASGRRLPDHAPRLFVQPPERVARAIVKCLRRPVAEVWTSHIVRTVAGVMTAFPWFMDAAMRGQVKGKERSARGDRH